MDLKTRERMQQLVEDHQDRTPATASAPPEKIRGLGDAVARVTKAVGIKPCGPCERRREWLNKYFPAK